MKTSSTPTRGPAMSWVTAGIVMIVAGMAMIPFNLTTAVGIGVIIGGVAVIGACFLRSNRSE